MKEVHESFVEYWNKVGAYFGSQDTITYRDGDDDWEGDDVIEFRDSCGCLLSTYNVDKEIARYN